MFSFEIGGVLYVLQETGCSMGIELGRESMGEPERISRFIWKSIGSALEGVPIVAFEPLPLNVKLRVQLDQSGPQMSVLQLRSAAIPPAMALPPEDERAHPIDQVFGVGL